MKQVLIVSTFFYDQVKFYAQLSWAWKRFYNLRGRLPSRPLLCFFTMFGIICVSLRFFTDEVEDPYADRTYISNLELNIGIKHGFSSIYICQVPWEALKTEAEGQVPCTPWGTTIVLPNLLPFRRPIYNLLLVSHYHHFTTWFWSLCHSVKVRAKSLVNGIKFRLI